MLQQSDKYPEYPLSSVTYTTSPKITYSYWAGLISIKAMNGENVCVWDVSSFVEGAKKDMNHLRFVDGL